MLNKSYSYLLPLFNQKCPIDGDYYVLLNNIYTRYNDKLNYFVIKYDDADNDEFMEYISKLHENALFEESFEEDDCLCLVFKFPEEYSHEYNCYANGNFSKFRDSAKATILDYILDVHNIRSRDNIRQVLYKEEELRQALEFKLQLAIGEDLELSSIPDITLETCYNLQKCTQN